MRAALGGNDFSSQGDHQTRSNPLFCFRPADISRLDTQARNKRKSQSGSVARTSTLLSHRLRALGDHLDRIQVSVFRIVWTLDSIVIVYQRVDGQYHCKIFTAEELQRLALQPRFRRSKRVSHSPAEYMKLSHELAICHATCSSCGRLSAVPSKIRLVAPSPLQSFG